MGVEPYPRQSAIGIVRDNPGATPSRRGPPSPLAPFGPRRPRVLFILDCRVVYVESIARVERLSLSGRILHLSRVADRLFVQWPDMARRFPRTTYAGRLY